MCKSCLGKKLNLLAAGSGLQPALTSGHLTERYCRRVKELCRVEACSMSVMTPSVTSQKSSSKGEEHQLLCGSHMVPYYWTDQRDLSQPREEKEESYWKYNQSGFLK